MMINSDRVIRILVTLVARVGEVTSMMASPSLKLDPTRSALSASLRASSGSLLPMKSSRDLAVMMKVPLT